MMETLIRRWESLPTGAQVAIALPVSVAFMFLLHIGPFNQPVGRGLGYAIFWGVLLGGAIIAASKAERARRRERDRAAGRDGDGR